MSIIRCIVGGIRALFHHERDARDLDREINSYLEIATREKTKAGMGRDEALRAARIEMGHPEQVKEDVHGWGWESRVETIWQDVRFAGRLMRKHPSFTLVAVLSLALGIGANTAIFSVINTVRLKLLPVKRPQELVLLEWSIPLHQRVPNLWFDGDGWKENGKDIMTPFSYAAFSAMRANNYVLTDLFALSDLGDRTNVVVDGESGLAHGQMASAGIFSTLGLEPVAGRFFSESDDRAGAPPVCVISGGYWNRRFGADPNIAGKRIKVAGVPFTIIGVAPPEFFGLQTGQQIDLWVPLATQPLVAPELDPRVSMFTARDHWWLVLMGRMKPGITRDAARAQLETAFHPVASDGLSAGTSGNSFPIPALEIAPGGNGLGALRRAFSRPLFILMVLVALVLLIACANVANLLLARGMARQKEIGMRLSLGASRGRLIRQLLTESFLLAGMGGVLGYLLAYWGSKVLVALITTASNPLRLSPTPDLRVLGFALAVCLITGLIFGLAPALRASRSDLAPALKQASQGFGTAGLRLGWGKTIVVAQVSLSLLLLFGAGLFVRTLVNLRHRATGFDKENVLLFGLNPTKSGYKEADLKRYYWRVQQRIASVPGVISATASWHLLLNNGRRSLSVHVPGYVLKPSESASVSVMPAGPGFFATMKIALLRGRDFSERDTENSRRVFVVNQAFVKRYFAGRDPLGQYIGLESAHQKPDGEIVGVVQDSKYESLRDDDPAIVYQPLQQAEDIPYMYFEARTAGDPLAMVPAVRAAVASVDPDIPMFGITTESRQFDDALMQERLFAKLTSFFGVLALALTSIGLYGILAYAVARRTQEIGIRMALGASQSNVLKMVLRETLVLAAAGVVIGVPAALATTRFASSIISDLLYGLGVLDTASVVIATATLIIVGVCAGILPARRASKVDPLTALRYE